MMPLEYQKGEDNEKAFGDQFIFNEAEKAFSPVVEGNSVSLR